VVTELGDAVVAAVDNVVELTADYGFDFRQQAEAAARKARRDMIGLSIGGDSSRWSSPSRLRTH
jgi:methyl-accepting chemotaxis protein